MGVCVSFKSCRYHSAAALLSADQAKRQGHCSDGCPQLKQMDASPFALPRALPVRALAIPCEKGGQYHRDESAVEFGPQLGALDLYRGFAQFTTLRCIKNGVNLIVPFRY